MMGRDLPVAALCCVVLAVLGHASARTAVLRLRNSSLSVQPGQGDDSAVDINAEQEILFSLGRGGAGRYEMADYASAYTDPETLQRTGGLNPFISDATIESNNSYILINETSPTPFTALELVLDTNNTLEVTGARLELVRSTLRALHTNWLLFTNASLLLNTSRLNLTNFFTWLVEDSIVDARDSLVVTSSFIIAWNRSSISLFNVSRQNLAPGHGRSPSRYTGKISPGITYIANSEVNATKTSWDVNSGSLWHVHNSSLSLSNSTLTLRNTPATVRHALLSLDASEVRLDNSSLVLGDVSSTLNVTKVVVHGQHGGDGGNATAVAQALVGSPLGSVPLELASTDAEIYLEDTSGSPV